MLRKVVVSVGAIVIAICLVAIVLMAGYADPTSDLPPDAIAPTGTLSAPLREPDPALTPGDALPVTAADVCTPGYSRRARLLSHTVRARVWQAYGLPPQGGFTWEIDHLISLELGGSDSIKNLWPEPGSGPMNYHDKDRLENTLHGDVCGHVMSLTDAQRAISRDWETAYRQYVEAQP